MYDYVIGIVEKPSGEIEGTIYETIKNTRYSRDVVREESFNVLTIIGDIIRPQSEPDSIGNHIWKDLSEDSLLLLGYKLLHPDRNNVDEYNYTGNAFNGELWVNSALENINQMSLGEFEIARANLELNLSYQLPWRDVWRATFDVPPDRENRSIFYSCATYNDVIFSILHYYVFAKLKVQRCRHCGKFFAVKSLKTEYCKEKSSLAGYESKTCYVARKAAWDTLQKKKKKVLEWLSYHQIARDKSDVLNTIYKLEDIIKQSPTAENIQKYHDFLYVDCEQIHKKYARVRVSK